MFICSRDSLLLCCLVLSLTVLFQLSLVAFSYSSSFDHSIPFEPVKYDRSYNKTPLHFPSALIIGVRKGGTRALLDALALHPLVRAVRKETHFFDDNYDKGIEWYSKAMPIANKNQLIIEKTPGYFTSPQAPLRVHQLNPSMKIILIVREPVQRTVSDFTQVYYNKLESNKSIPVFEKEIFVPGSNDTLNQEYKPLRNSLYHLHLANWLRYFSLEQILLVNGDVFRGNPLSELRRVESFLSLPPSISTDQLIFNHTKGFFCFRRSLSSSPKCLGTSKGRPHREIDERVLERVRRRLAEHNQIFFRQVNRIYSW